MSEPTNGGKQQPGPDPERGPEEDEVQDQIPESVFNDPTAPVWADPTAPIPAPPTPPGAARPQSDEPAANPQTNPPAAPPMSNPYAQQPPAQPYGQPQPAQQYPAYGQPYDQPQPAQQYPAYGQPYDQPQPAQQYPAYGQQPYATGPHIEPNGSAIVLTILSGLSLIFCNIFAIASLVVGIIALGKNSTDPARSRRLTKIGWIVFAGVWALVILGLIAFFALALSNGWSTSDTNISY
jgi:hypothetical protein